MFFIAVLMTIVPHTAPPQVPWHHPLYLGNGGLWGQRIPVVIQNESNAPSRGTPVSVSIGSGIGEVNLVGTRAAEVRVCNEKGTEVLFELTSPAGTSLHEGRIPDGSKLTIPADCPAQGEARYYIYFDNPRAWAPADWLEATGDLRNGSVEEGEGDAPAGWTHDSGDSSHIASWATEDAHTGRRCLKLEVAQGASPSWISTRQAGIRIVGGARYRMTGWVKAHGVEGYAGWYIHLGNATNSMIAAPMLSAGGGTYDWKEVKLDFTAPADADRADLGTVLWGTGTAWFDDVTLEPLEPVRQLHAKVLPKERLDVRKVGASTSWWIGPDVLHRPNTRLALQVLNLTAEARGGFVSVPAAATVRLHRYPTGGRGVAVVTGGRRVPHYRMGDTVLFEATVPAKSVATMYLYPVHASGHKPKVQSQAVEYAPNPAVPGGMNRKTETMEPAEYAALLGSQRNLVRNASFEKGDRLPDAWAGGAEGQRPPGTQLGLVAGGLFGKKCVRMHIPANVPLAWTGWRQDVAVRPNRMYLFAAWLRCEKLQGGAQIHVHLRKENGELAGQSAMQGAGPAITGTTGWTLISGLFRTPEDCRIFQVHLTMLATGTLYHDGVVVLEVMPGEAVNVECRDPVSPYFRVWSVNPLVKVFREDGPPRAAGSGAAPVRISCAGNEYEPVQLAVRSSTGIRGVQVVVEPPKDAHGTMLRDWEVGLVRYVPIDTVTNYYSDRTAGHIRKVPRGPAGSDGWPGWWPDPIVPGNRFDLQPGQTQPVWLTLYVPRGTRAGEYRGAVRFVASGKTLANIPIVVQVRAFDLPDRPSLKAIYDVRQSGTMWRIPGKTEAEAREAFWRFMAQHRLCPDTIRPEPRLEYRDGVVHADFTEFDRAARIYFEELKFPHAYTPWHFYLFGWGHLPGDKFGEKPYEGQYPYEGVNRAQLRPEYRRAYQACLKAFWDHVKAMGWADRFVLYISDEPHDHRPEIVTQMKALCDMIHEVDPSIPIYCSTWHHQPEWDGKLNVWGIGHYGIVPVDKMRELLRNGARIWWTTDGQMCTDTPYCAIERLLPHYCFKYGAEAYEFWGVDWLTYDPYKFGWHAFLPHDFGVGEEKVFVRYPNGDGFLAYPPAPLKLGRPVPSVRMEQAREGVEDYEYLVLLRRAVEQGRAAGKDVAVGEEALRQVSALVESPCEIGRYSTRILPDPDRVLRVRDLVANAIEQLQGSGT